MGRLLHPIRILHLLHRWLGIALGVVVLLWFLSGLVMLFVAYPHLDEEQRLHPLPRIPAGELQVTPLAAWQSLGRTDWPEAVRLDAEPGFAVYRFLAERRWWAVDAKNSRRIEPLDAGQAAAHVLALRGGAVQQVVPIERDQWTVSRRYEAWRPLYRVELADGRDVYVSRNGGDVVLETTFAERSWNWLGSVLHWGYFTPHLLIVPLAVAASLARKRATPEGPGSLHIETPTFALTVIAVIVGMAIFACGPVVAGSAPTESTSCRFRPSDRRDLSCASHWLCL